VASPAQPPPDRVGASAGLAAGFQHEVLAVGRTAGLDAVGVAPAVRFDRARTAIEARLADGLDGGLPFTFRKPAR